MASESLSTSITNMISRETSALKTSKRRKRDARAKEVMPFTEATADTLLNTMKDTSEVTHSMTIMMKDHNRENYQGLSDLATTDTEDQEKLTLINTVLKKQRLMKLKVKSNHRNNKKMLNSQLIIKKRRFSQNPILKMVKKKSKWNKCQFLNLNTSKSMLRKQFKSQSQEKILKTQRSLNNKRNLKRLIMKWRLHQLHWKIMTVRIKIKKRLILKRNNTRRLRPLCCSKINPWTHTQLTP